MRRGLWFAAGAGAGVYAVTRAQRVVEAFTPDGLRDRLQAVGLGARLLREEVAQASSDKETELRERWGLRSQGVRELAPVGSTRPTRAPAEKGITDGHR